MAFYGDDFTGSTDALEFLTRAGAKTVLFIAPPSAEQLGLYPGLQAYGVAGMTRSLSPAKMEEVLLPAFETIKQSGVRHVHYKTCSTFDSSPTTGSIGKAIDTGAAIFNNKLIPLLVAAPLLGRYCLFGNLFARMGIGSEGDIFRLDRHPSMSKHPVTPSDESDLRLHLSKQTNKNTGLINILQLENPVETMNEKNDDAEIILIDALYDEQLLKIGTWIDQQYNESSSLFSVGSSGIEMALGKYWNKQQILHPVTEWKHPGEANPLLVVSGSCSPVTASQIAWAIANGFAEVEIDALAICSAHTSTLDTYIEEAAGFIRHGKSLVVHTGEKQINNLSSQNLGTALGLIAKQLVITEKIKRVLIAGGDTSSYAARAMDVEAVEMIAPLVSGAPLCKAISKNESINGLELNFKGGQVGSEDYFGLVRGGGEKMNDE